MAYGGPALGAQYPGRCGDARILEKVKDSGLKLELRFIVLDVTPESIRLDLSQISSNPLLWIV